MIMTGKPEYWEKNLPHCHFVYHKCHPDWIGIEPGRPRCDAGDTWVVARPSRWPVLLRKPLIFLGISWRILHWDKTFTSRSAYGCHPAILLCSWKGLYINQEQPHCPHSVRNSQLIPIACVTSYEHQDACNSSPCAAPPNACSLHHKIDRIISIGHQNICFLGVAFDSFSLQFS